MLCKTQGIVINSIKYGDSSIVTKIFTEEFGLLPFMINGVRSKKSTQKPVLFQPLSLLELVIYKHDKKQLQNVKEVKMLLNPVQIYMDISKSSMVVFIAELLQKILKEHYVNEGLFAIIKEFVEELNEAHNHTSKHLQIMLAIADQLGFYPQNNYSFNHTVFSIADGSFIPNNTFIDWKNCLDENDSKILHQLLEQNDQNFSKTEKHILIQFFIRYFQYHIPEMGNLKSVDVLKEVFD